MNPPGVEVTVIVVAYNHAQFVGEALDSIVGQTVLPHRIVVIDDASTDNTVEVIQAWMASHAGAAEFVRHTTNIGLCRGLNEVLATVDTPLYTYLSADDRMAPRRIELQSTCWVEDGSEAVGVYSHAKRIDAEGNELMPPYRVLHDWPPTAQLTGDIHAALLHQCWIPAASVLLNTSAVRAVGGYDERWFFEDYDLWLRLAAHGRFLLVDESLVDFRELEDSLGSTRFRDDDLGFLEARVGVWTKQFGVSREGDDYLRRALPPLAIRLWRRGGNPVLAADAFGVCCRGAALNLRLRRSLIRSGIGREPKLLTSLSKAAAEARRLIRRVT